MKQFLLLIILFTSLISTAQKTLRYDTSVVVQRTFSNKELLQLKSDSDFQYEKIIEPTQSLWSRFWIWFWYKIQQILSTKNGRTTMWMLFILFAVSVITFFVLKLIGMNRQALFSRDNKASIDYNVSSDNIHAIDFDNAIEEAKETANYRLAIRLLYLQSLKKLSDKNLIDWKSNKTNSDYLREVSTFNWSSLFSKLTYSFDYTWYGEMPVTKETFSEVNENFKTFYNQL